MQAGKPVAYASRALTTTEQNYAQIEKELFTIVFEMERFHRYTYGRPVSVETDQTFRNYFQEISTEHTKTTANDASQTTALRHHSYQQAWYSDVSR